MAARRDERHDHHHPNEGAPMTVKETADRLHLSVTSVYRLIAIGQIDARKVGPRGGKILADDQSVEDYWQRSFRTDKSVHIGEYEHIKFG
jgi:excisionase family DNA binding protein